MMFPPRGSCIHLIVACLILSAMMTMAAGVVSERVGQRL